MAKNVILGHLVVNFKIELLSVTCARRQRCRTGLRTGLSRRCRVRSRPTFGAKSEKPLKTHEFQNHILHVAQFSEISILNY